MTRIKTDQNGSKIIWLEVAAEHRDCGAVHPSGKAIPCGNFFPAGLTRENSGFNRAC
jgi:hypothetical protein